MNRTNWKEYAELIGIAAIVASLIFVGQQMRLDRRIAIGGAWLQHVESQQSLAELINENSELWIRGLNGEELSPVDELKFDEIVFAVQSGFTSRYARSAMGIRDAAPASFEALKWAHEMHLHPGLRKSVSKRWSRWDEISDHRLGFRDEVEEYLEKFDKGELKAAAEKQYSF